MSTELFIAKRLYFDEEGRQRSSRPAVRIAVAGIAIGVMVMVLTLAVVVGFKRTVTEKVALFGAHIQVTHFEDNSTFERHPVTVTDSLLTRLRHLPYIVSADAFLTKPGILKTDNDFQGIVLRASASDTAFVANLLKGTMPVTANEVTVSQSVASRLRLQLGDEVYCYFVGEEIRARKWRIAGIYATGFLEADNLFVWCRPEVIRRLNGWTEQQASGIALRVDKPAHIDEATETVWYATANRLDEEGDALYTQSLKELNPQIFAWLDLLDMNVVVIILLMLAVSVFNIISGLIILILDSITLVGTLKALGAGNCFVQRIFLWEAAMLIGKGMLWGNIIGLALAAAQFFTHLLPLDATSYYVNYVPVAFPWLWLVVLNIGIILVALLSLLAPVTIAARISPARVIKYD